MRFKIRFSPEAVRDIEEVLRFTLDNFGDRKCNQYRDLIRDALAAISKDPFSIHSKPRPEIHPTVRTYHIGRPGKKARHLFLYRYDKSDTVVVGRLLHEAMDTSRHSPWDFDRE